MELDVEQLRKTVAQIDALQIVGQQYSFRGSAMVAPSTSSNRRPSLDDPDAFELCLKGEMRGHLAEAIATLTEREQLILSLYYREELTMKEIAAVVGVALSRVSQIRVAAIDKLRRALAHTAARPETRFADPQHVAHI